MKKKYNGYQITFFDTAGIRKTKNLVEKEELKSKSCKGGGPSTKC